MYIYIYYTTACIVNEWTGYLIHVVTECIFKLTSTSFKLIYYLARDVDY